MKAQCLTYHVAFGPPLLTQCPAVKTTLWFGVLTTVAEQEKRNRPATKKTLPWTRYGKALASATGTVAALALRLAAPAGACPGTRCGLPAAGRAARWTAEAAPRVSVTDTGRAARIRAGVQNRTVARASFALTCRRFPTAAGAADATPAQARRATTAAMNPRLRRARSTSAGKRRGPAPTSGKFEVCPAR